MLPIQLLGNKQGKIMSNNKTVKLNREFINNVVIPNTGEVKYRDSNIKGLTFKVTSAGKKVFLLQYRFEGVQRKPKIGNLGDITLEQAKNIAKQWLGQIASGVDPMALKQAKKQEAASDINMRQLYELLKEQHLTKVKVRTAYEYKRIWNSNILPNMGSIKVKHIDKQAVIALHNQLSTTPYQANRTIAVLSKSLELAEAWGYREGTNPCKYVDKYKEQKKERYLKPHEVQGLQSYFNQCIEQQTMPFNIVMAFRLLLFTGARKNEILTLKWEYIDFRNNTINLPDSKTGKKTIYPPKFVFDWLKEIPKSSEYVFESNRKSGLPFQDISKKWRSIRGNIEYTNKEGLPCKLDLSDVRVHDLRHTYASFAANNGITLTELGKLLGHNNPQTTARYAHLFDDTMKQASNKIGQVIKEAANLPENVVSIGKRSA